MTKGRDTHVFAQLWRVPCQKTLKPARRRHEKLVVRVLDGRRQILAGEVIKDLGQEDLGLCDDFDVGWWGSQKECCRLPKEVEEWVHETTEDEVDLCVEFVGSDL